MGGPTSTSVYTAIFAAGLVIDGTAKLRRNQEWNEAFASLKEDSVTIEGGGEFNGSEESQESWQPTTQDQIPLSAFAHVAPIEESLCLMGRHVPLEKIWPGGVDWALIRELVGEELSEELRSATQETEPEFEALAGDEWELLSFDSRFPGMQFLPLNVYPGLFVRHHLPPQSLWSYDNVRTKALENRLSTKKILVQEAAMGIFIASLLDEAGTVSSLDCAYIAPALRTYETLGKLEKDLLRASSEKELANLKLEPASSLNTEGIRWARYRYNQMWRHATPEYTQDQDGEFLEISEAMNASIKNIFAEAKNPSDHEIAAALYKIAHNLFVSSAPPDLQTFNILVTGFKRWSRPHLVNKTIRTFKDCKIRPNEISCAVILNHYTRQNDISAFTSFVLELRAHSKALMLARPDININEAGQSRLIRLENGTVYQKMYPMPMIFNALLQGVLKWAGLERALEVYYNFKQDGWGLDILGLTSLLASCVRHADWNRAVGIWDEILSIKHGAEIQHMAKAYANMLSLCTVTGNTAAYKHFIKEITTWSNDLQKQGLEKFTPEYIVNWGRSFLECLRMERKHRVRRTRAHELVEPHIKQNLLNAVCNYVGHSSELDNSKLAEWRNLPLRKTASYQRYPPPHETATEIENSCTKDAVEPSTTENLDKPVKDIKYTAVEPNAAESPGKAPKEAKEAALASFIRKIGRDFDQDTAVESDGTKPLVECVKNAAAEVDLRKPIDDPVKHSAAEADVSKPLHEHDLQTTALESGIGTTPTRSRLRWTTSKILASGVSGSNVEPDTTKPPDDSVMKTTAGTAVGLEATKPLEGSAKNPVANAAAQSDITRPVHEPRLQDTAPESDITIPLRKIGRKMGSDSPRTFSIRKTSSPVIPMQKLVTVKNTSSAR